MRTFTSACLALLLVTWSLPASAQHVESADITAPAAQGTGNALFATDKSYFAPDGAWLYITHSLYASTKSVSQLVDDYVTSMKDSHPAAPGTYGAYAFVARHDVTLCNGQPGVFLQQDLTGIGVVVHEFQVWTLSPKTPIYFIWKAVYDVNETQSAASQRVNPSFVDALSTLCVVEP